MYTFIETKHPKREIKNTRHRKTQYFILEKNIEIVEDANWKGVYSPKFTTYSVNDATNQYHQLLDYKKECEKRGGVCMYNNIQVSSKSVNNDVLFANIRGILQSQSGKQNEGTMSIEDVSLLLDRFSVEEVKKMLPTDWLGILNSTLEHKISKREADEIKSSISGLEDKSDELIVRITKTENLVDVVGLFDQVIHFKREYFEQMKNIGSSPEFLTTVNREIKIYECCKLVCKGLFEKRLDYFESAYSLLQEVSMLLPTTAYPMSLLCEVMMRNDKEFTDRQIDSIVQSTIAMEKTLHLGEFPKVEIPVHQVYMKSFKEFFAGKEEYKQKVSAIAEYLKEVSKTKESESEESPI